MIAEILRPRGNRGEVIAKSQTDVPGRIETLKAASAELADGSDVQVEIVEAWPHKGNWVLKFAGIDSINAAERFRGADLWLPFADRGTLAEGDFFRSDLIGCTVLDSAGRQLGALQGWQQYGGPPLMEVMIGDREVLIPFVPELCSTDLAGRIIRVDLPEGLLESIVE